MSDTPKDRSEEPAESPATSPPEDSGPPPSGKPGDARRGGGGLAALALLLALVALGLAGWPWWQAFQGDDDSGRLRAGLLSELQQRLDAANEEQRARLVRLEQETRQLLEDAVAASEDRAEETGQTLRRRLERGERDLASLLAEVESGAASLAERERELEATVAGLRRAFSDLAGQVVEARPPDTREWRIAEAAYLLRIANQRARLERDLRGAHDLLAAADDILSQLDDYSLVPVREALVQAKAALAAQPAVDRVVLYLELEAVALGVDALPIRGPEFRAADPATDAGADGAGVLAALERRLRGLFDFRRHRGEQIRPLLTPDGSFWRHHNIRLRLSQAQLALLRGQQEVWAGSLLGAEAWIREFPEAAELADEVAALAERPVRVTAPDISEPLRRLDAVRTRVPMAANP
ncbi:MAG: uroporphyrinogen-III C-methyltransferase [Gammaproteobacteria bacterium]|nr:uroporphyrinogen-III C-methyltransferase [Gammaproteobacteria bacterium]